MKKIAIADLVVPLNRLNGYRVGDAGVVLELDLDCVHYWNTPAVRVLWSDGCKLWEPIKLMHVVKKPRSK